MSAPGTYSSPESLAIGAEAKKAGNPRKTNSMTAAMIRMIPAKTSYLLLLLPLGSSQFGMRGHSDRPTEVARKRRRRRPFDPVTSFCNQSRARAGPCQRAHGGAQVLWISARCAQRPRTGGILTGEATQVRGQAPFVALIESRKDNAHARERLARLGGTADDPRAAPNRLM
jgi:hypothetical protein